jgi:succinate dehydrogenase / fumarate reductase cytochrome b subunit
MERAPAQSPAGAEYLWSKLASLLGIVPLGVWTVVHVWNNLAVFQGPDAWRESVTTHSQPIALGLITFVVLAAIVLHALWGLGRLFTSRPNNAHYPTFANLTYLLQRVSALGVLAFLGAHVWLAFLRPRLVEHQAETFEDIAATMHNHTPTLVVYILGTLGVAYHLGNGLYGFAWSSGLGASRRSLRGFLAAGVVLFVALLAMSWAAIWGLWRAGG